MEDKYIFKGEYCYSFRIDVDWEDQQIVKQVATKLQEYFNRYRLSKENKKDGIKHFQGILWRDQPLGKTQPQQIRTYFKQKMKIQKGGHSLVSARKVRSLAKYCSDKEKKGYIDHNIPENVDLGKWQNVDAEKEVLKDKFREKLKDFKFEDLEDGEDYEVEESHMYNKYTKEHSSWMTPSIMDIKSSMKYQLLELALKEVWTKEVKVRPPPINTLLHIARQEGVLSNKLFIYLYYNL